jgi:hypothetical protein
VDPSFKLIVAQAGREFMGSPYRQRPTKPIWHYTTADGLDGILAKGVIWATDYRHLYDDPEELTRAERIIAAELDALISQHGKDTVVGDLCRRMRQAREKHRVIDIPGIGIYITSFSDEPEIPNQWRVYGNNFGGYSIGFNRIPLPEGEPKPTKLTVGMSIDFGPCIYDDDVYRARVHDIISFVATGLLKYAEAYGSSPEKVELLCREARNSALAKLGASVWFLKRRLYSGEQELRLVHVGKPPATPLTRPCGSKTAEYIEVSLRHGNQMDLHRVIVGAKGDQQLASDILERTGYANVPLVASFLTPT